MEVLLIPAVETQYPADQQLSVPQYTSRKNGNFCLRLLAVFVFIMPTNQPTALVGGIEAKKCI